MFRLINICLWNSINEKHYNFEYPYILQLDNTYLDLTFNVILKMNLLYLYEGYEFMKMQNSKEHSMRSYKAWRYISIPKRTLKLLVRVIISMKNCSNGPRPFQFLYTFILTFYFVSAKISNLLKICNRGPIGWKPSIWWLVDQRININCNFD